MALCVCDVLTSSWRVVFYSILCIIEWKWQWQWRAPAPAAREREKRRDESEERALLHILAAYFTRILRINIYLHGHRWTKI
jgi:hypothetical protein